MTQQKNARDTRKHEPHKGLTKHTALINVNTSDLQSTYLDPPLCLSPQTHNGHMAQPTDVTSHPPTMQWLAAFPPALWDITLLRMIPGHAGWILHMEVQFPVDMENYGPLYFRFTIEATIIHVESHEHLGGFSHSSTDPYWL